MDDLLKIILASGISGGTVGVVGFLLVVWRIKGYIGTIEKELADHNAKENKRIWSEIDKKSSRVRVEEVEKRVKTIEDTGLNHVWRDAMTQQLTEIFDKLSVITESLGALKALPRQLEKVETKLDRHIENDK